jgi:5-deoxy-glucuronate isomerase
MVKRTFSIVMTRFTFRESTVEVMTDSDVDLAEFPHQYRTDIRQHPCAMPMSRITRRCTSNLGPGASRHVNLLLAKNFPAGRLVAGFTDSKPGNWTSWPSHEHAKMLKEMYVYFNMPEPGLGDSARHPRGLA